jgi:multidrug resistance protein
VNDSERNRLLAVLFVGVLMGALDIAIVGPALPAIRAEFGIDARAASWIFSVYVLVNLVSAPFMAKLSDRWGRRRVYVLDVTAFALGSLAVALAPTYWALLIGRALQAAGAGGIFPVASAVVGDVFPPDRRGRALGLIGAVFGLAFLLGPLLGGLLLPFGWSWLFLINLPIAAWLIFGGARLVPDERPEVPAPFDVAGMILLGAGLTALALGLSLLDTARVGASLASWPVGPLLVAVLLVAPAFWIIERRAADPIVRPSLLRPLPVRLVLLFAAGAGVTEAAMVFLPSLAVETLGVAEHIASFLLMPLVLALAIGSPLVGRLVDRLGAKPLITTGLALTAAGLATFGLTPGSLVGYLLASVATGFGLASLLGAPLRYVLLREADEADRGASQGVLTVFTSTGQLVGAAVVGAVTASAASRGFASALLVLAVAMAALVAASFALTGRAPRDRGAEASASTD